MPSAPPTITMASRTGRGQRSENEDNCACGVCPCGWYAIVADGAGGHSRGAEAAARSVRLIETLLMRAAPEDFSSATLAYIVREAHVELQAMQLPNDPSAAMHTTVVVAWISARDQSVLWGHVGDSRLYRIRHSLVNTVTVDDSIVQRMVDLGQITAAQARFHPLKNQLYAALGVDREVDAHVLPRPSNLVDGDAFLLCTDGWWDSFENLGLCATLERSVDVDDWLTRMERVIVQRQLPRQDNFTAIAVWFGLPDRLLDDDYNIDDTVANTIPNTIPGEL